MKNLFGSAQRRSQGSTWSTSFRCVRWFPCRSDHLLTVSPLVKYIPAWVPGAGFQRLAAHVKNLNHNIRNGPWENVLKDVVSRFRSSLNHSRTLVGLWGSSSQPGGQTDRATWCEWDNEGFGGNYLFK